MPPVDPPFRSAHPVSMTLVVSDRAFRVVGGDSVQRSIGIFRRDGHYGHCGEVVGSPSGDCSAAGRSAVERPRKQRRRRRWLIAAASAIALVLLICVGGWLWWLPSFRPHLRSG